MMNANFNSAYLDGVLFKGYVDSASCIISFHLTGANFSGAFFIRATDFTGANMTRANLSRAHLNRLKKGEIYSTAYHPCYRLALKI